MVTFSPTDQYVTLLYVCFCVKEASYLLCIVNVELMSSHAWMELIQHMHFHHKVHHSLPVLLGTLDWTSALRFGWGQAILNSEITNKKHKIVKNMTLNRLKGVLVCGIRAEIRRQSKLCSTSGNVFIRGSHFFDSLPVCRRLLKQHLLDFAVTNKVWWAGEFENMRICKKNKTK